MALSNMSMILDKANLYYMKLQASPESQVPGGEWKLCYN